MLAWRNWRNSEKIILACVVVAVSISAAAIMGYYYGIQREKTRQAAIEKPATNEREVIYRTITKYKDKIITVEKITKEEQSKPVIPEIPSYRSTYVGVGAGLTFSPAPSYSVEGGKYFCDWASAGLQYIHHDDVDMMLFKFSIHF